MLLTLGWSFVSTADYETPLTAFHNAPWSISVLGCHNRPTTTSTVYVPAPGKNCHVQYKMDAHDDKRQPHLQAVWQVLDKAITRVSQALCVV